MRVAALLVVAASWSACSTQPIEPSAADLETLELVRTHWERIAGPPFQGLLLATPEERYLWSVRFLKAEMVVSPDRSREHYQAHLDRMTQLEEFRQVEMKRARASLIDVDVAAFYRAEAQAWLARASR